MLLPSGAPVRPRLPVAERTTAAPRTVLQGPCGPPPLLLHAPLLSRPGPLVVSPTATTLVGAPPTEPTVAAPLACAPPPRVATIVRRGLKSLAVVLIALRAGGQPRAPALPPLGRRGPLLGEQTIRAGAPVPGRPRPGDKKAMDVGPRPSVGPSARAPPTRGTTKRCELAAGEAIECQGGGAGEAPSRPRLGVGAAPRGPDDGVRAPVAAPPRPQFASVHRVRGT